MKWIAISGSWRYASPIIAHDVRTAVADIMKRGDGIVTGGALGVDYLATQVALEYDSNADRIKIIIPTSLPIYAQHYRKRAQEGVITSMQAENLIEILQLVKQRRADALVEMNHYTVNEITYYDRNSRVLMNADELLAFQANHSAGTQDTIDKARELGLAVVVKQYTVN